MIGYESLKIVLKTLYNCSIIISVLSFINIDEHRILISTTYYLSAKNIIYNQTSVVKFMSSILSSGYQGFKNIELISNPDHDN